MRRQLTVFLLYIILLIKFNPINAGIELCGRVLVIESQDFPNNDTDFQKSDTNSIRKCCPVDKYVGAKRACMPYSQTLNFTNVPLYTRKDDGEMYKTGRTLEQVYNLTESIFPHNQKFRHAVFDYSIIKHNYFLTEEATLYEESPNECLRWYLLNSSLFCVDYQLPNNRNVKVPTLKFWTILDIKKPVRNVTFITVGLLVSCVFMLLVLAVYALLPELRNLGGMVLMAYVASLLCAFLMLAIIQIRRYPTIVCLILSYSTYFCFLASFCWMNVMSCDIWWTFRGYAKARPVHRRGEMFKYSMYSAYAWGLPLIMTVFVAILNHINLRHKPWIVTPNILKKACFFEDESKHLYLYAPMFILIVCNWVFFLMTVFNIWRLHRRTAVLDSHASGTPAAHRKQKYRLLIYFKLSIVMGINWLLEVVSSFNPQFQLWYITDLYNVLIGVSIFLIFVCKKKIFKRVVEEISGKIRVRRQSQSSKSHMSNTTNTDSDVSQEAPLQVCPHPKGPLPTVYVNYQRKI